MKSVSPSVGGGDGGCATLSPPRAMDWQRMGIDEARPQASAAAAVSGTRIADRPRSPTLSRKQRELAAARAQGFYLPARGNKGKKHRERNFYGRERDRYYGRVMGEQGRAWEREDAKVKRCESEAMRAHEWRWKAERQRKEAEAAGKRAEERAAEAVAAAATAEAKMQSMHDLIPRYRVASALLRSHVHGDVLGFQPMSRTKVWSWVEE